MNHDSLNVCLWAVNVVRGSWFVARPTQKLTGPSSAAPVDQSKWMKVLDAQIFRSHAY